MGTWTGLTSACQDSASHVPVVARAPTVAYSTGHLHPPSQPGLVQPRPIKHPALRFGVAPGGPAVAGRPPRTCRRSRGWSRPGGTLGGPAVGDSGPPHGPDRRAPKQANISSLTRLYTALQSASPRALRHSFPSGTCNADSTLRQLRRACFRPAASLYGSLRSPRGTDAAGKSTQHDDAANLVAQACSGHHLDSSRCRISRYSGVS